MFTAVAIAQLEEQGKLAYTDKASKFLADFPHKEVTVHQLLTHTSGLGSYFGPKFAAVKDRIKGPGEILPFCDELDSPGAFSYSNCGFIVLGAIIEKISGQSYDDYIRDHVTGPAGMADTRPYEKNEVVENLATGYTRSCEVEPSRGEKGPRCSNVIFLPRKGSSAGGGYSTAPDMLKFAGALLSGKLVSAQSLATLTTGKVEMKPKGAPPRPGMSVKYGYGFGEVIRNGLRSFGHEGGAQGINSSFAVFPERKTVIIVFSNYDPEEGAGMEIKATLERALHGDG
jgi:CubicO group peptidase (beta-lactamase class C family)